MPRKKRNTKQAPRGPDPTLLEDVAEDTGFLVLFRLPNGMWGCAVKEGLQAVPGTTIKQALTQAYIAAA